MKQDEPINVGQKLNIKLRIRIDQTLKDRLTILAKSYNITVSELIRRMIDFSLENY